MASVSEQVIVALVALVEAALPLADADRNRAKPQSVDGNGTVIVRDGDPGGPEIDLSPFAYKVSHRIPLDLAIYGTAADTAETRLDALRLALATAVMADRTLGGRCQFLDLQPGETGNLDAPGAVPGRWAEVVVVADYVTASPL